MTHAALKTIEKRKAAYVGVSDDEAQAIYSRRAGELDDMRALGLEPTYEQSLAWVGAEDFAKAVKE